MSAIPYTAEQFLEKLNQVTQVLDEWQTLSADLAAAVSALSAAAEELREVVG